MNYFGYSGNNAQLVMDYFVLAAPINFIPGYGTLAYVIGGLGVIAYEISPFMPAVIDWVENQGTQAINFIGNNIKNQVNEFIDALNNTPDPNDPKKDGLLEKLNNAIEKIKNSSSEVNQTVKNWGIKKYGTFGSDLNTVNSAYRRASMRILQQHHIIPQRITNIFGKETVDSICAVIRSDYHQFYTNAWENAAKLMSGKNPIDEILAAGKMIYANNPEMLKAFTDVIQTFLAK